MGQDQSSAKDRDYDFVIDISNTKVNKGKWPCYLNHKHIQHLREYLKKDDTHQDERPHVIKKVEPVILGERIEAAIDDFLLQSGQVDIVSVIGGYKTGKTFLLNMLFDINLPVGVTIASKTQGLSFKLPGTRPGHNHVLLDTGSLGAPVEEVTHDDMEKQLKQRDAIIEKVVASRSSTILVVINEPTSADQKLILNMGKAIRQQGQVCKTNKRIFVIHNFKNTTTDRGVYDLWQKYVLSAYPEAGPMVCYDTPTETTPAKSSKQWERGWLPLLEVDHCQIHLLLANNGSYPGQKYNHRTIRYLQKAVMKAPPEDLRPSLKTIRQELSNCLSQYLINPQIAWKADLTSPKTMSLPRRSLTSHDAHVEEDVPYTKWQLRKQKDAKLDKTISPLWLDIEGPRREGNETAAGRDVPDSEEDDNITFDPTVDVLEDEDGFHVILELPGFEAEDHLQTYAKFTKAGEGLLVISGRRKELKRAINPFSDSEHLDLTKYSYCARQHLHEGSSRKVGAFRKEINFNPQKYCVRQRDPVIQELGAGCFQISVAPRRERKPDDEKD